MNLCRTLQRFDASLGLEFAGLGVASMGGFGSGPASTH